MDPDQLLERQIREYLVMSENPITYGGLARVLNVVGPGSIARVTAALESLMREDAAAGRPFVAALCQGKMTDGLPALGFFQMAAALGRYCGPATGPEAMAFVQAQRLAALAAKR